MTVPIALFVFARPDHTRRTLEALAANQLAAESDLFIFADAARSEKEAERVAEVRELIRKTTGFKSVTIQERESNAGLATNIVEGVGKLCEEFGQAIVLEDDIVTSPGFLHYMNSALDAYRDDPRVWHISGWNYPINPEGLEDTFFLRVMNCWGWATWADRWAHYEKDPEKLMNSWSARKIGAFNLNESINFWKQVETNASGQLNTWAIFWYATIFGQGGLCLNPTVPLVANIGLDGTGENCGQKAEKKITLPDYAPLTFPMDVRENANAVRKIKKLHNARHKRPIRRHVRTKLRRLLKHGFAR